MDGSGLRKQNFVHSRKSTFRLDAEIGRARLQVFNSLSPEFGLRLVLTRRTARGRLPVGISKTRPPPVIGRMKLLPQQPDLARVFGQQVLARKAESHSEALCAFAHQHDGAGMFPHGLLDQSPLLDVAHAANRSCAPRRPVHAAGVEFHHAFFVGNSAQTDRIVIGIVFRTFHHLEGSIECVSPTFQKGECVFEISVAVVGANNDGALVRSGLGVAFWRGALLGLLSLRLRSESSGDCSEKGSLNEITARESHVPPAGRKAGSISRKRVRPHLAWLSRYMARKQRRSAKTPSHRAWAREE